MRGVRLLASIFAWIGWIALILGALAVMGTAATIQNLTRSPGGSLSVLTLLGPIFLASLGPFLAWGVLTGLSEIHRESERVREQLGDAERAIQGLRRAFDESVSKRRD